MRAYDAEFSVAELRNAEAISMLEAWEMAQLLFEHFEVPHLPVKQGRQGATRSWYRWKAHRPHMITLRTMATRWDVCHEVAHYLNHVLHGYKGHHNVAWAHLYVRCVSLTIGDRSAERLQRAFAKVGLLPEPEAVMQ